VTDLDALMAHIGDTWVCDAARYPELQGMNEEAHRNFVVKHSLMHILKTTGKIASCCEDFDHTHTAGPEEGLLLQELAIKLVVNALKLAEEVGLSADDLLQRAPRYIK
jgi:hypothetical protein